MSKSLNSFDDGLKIGSEKTLRRWRSASNGRRSFHKLADSDEHLKLRERDRVSCLDLKAALCFTRILSLHTSSECNVTEAATEAERFDEPIDDNGSTVNGRDEMITGCGKFILRLKFQISKYATSIIVLYTKICERRVKYEIRALAVVYLVVEVASFSLDIFGESKLSFLLVAFILSACGFAITVSRPTCIVRRIRAAATMHNQQLQPMVLEISFSAVQLIVTSMHFFLAKIGFQMSIKASLFPLVFAIISASFTFICRGEVSDSSGLATTQAPAADNQVRMPNNTRNGDAEANGSIPMLGEIVTSDD